MNKENIKKVVLAYSGGLDTSIIIPCLKAGAVYEGFINLYGLPTKVDAIVNGAAYADLRQRLSVYRKL